MRFQPRHRWDLSPAQAMALQQSLRHEVLCQDHLGPVRTVAGVDVGFEAQGRVARAAVAVLSFPDLSLKSKAIARSPVTFPYIPGLLSFRETPVVLKALEALDELPDALLYDGHGLAHPRRFGIACHVGLLTDIPSIGVAKRRLVGRHETLAEERGAWKPLIDQGEIIGAVLRTQRHTPPVFVSIGHKVSLETAIDLVLCCTRADRLPETTRWAHRLASGWV
ncbi:MAG: deoxyribonuclease V [Chloroflexota bacterium]